MNSPQKATLILKNGIIYTVDGKCSVTEAIAVKDDIILFVGKGCELESFIGPETKIIDLHGKMVLPGFIDCHTHPSVGTDVLYSTDLTGLSSVDQYMEKIRTLLRKQPAPEFLYGFGWDEAVFQKTLPKKEMLDALSDKIPIILWDEPYHNMWVNSKALDLAGINEEAFLNEPGILRNEKKEPVGVLQEMATELITSKLPQYTLHQCEKGLEYFQSIVAPYGFTSVFEACIYPEKDRPGFPGNHAMEAFSRMARQGKLTCRYSSSIVIDPDEKRSAEDMIKLVIDYKNKYDSPLFQLTAMKIYLDYWSEAALKEVGIAADRAGIQLFLHALQEKETTRGLNVCEYIKNENPGSECHHSIAHVGVVSPEDLKRFAPLNITSVILPQWITHIEEYYGRTSKRYHAGQLDLINSFFKNNVIVASATAYPAITTRPRPLEAIQMGMTRLPIGCTDTEQMQKPADERVSLDQMIRSFTINGAYANFQEKITGSLEAGKKADMVILDKDLRILSPHEIYTAKEECTIMNGKVTYSI